MNKYKIKQLVLIVFWAQGLLVKADNNCRIDKVEIPISQSRVILAFECYSGIDYNPTIPIDNGSNQWEYNELDLSPNLFTELPIEQLCPFFNVYLLDLSHNKIMNLKNAFKKLRCLKRLKILNLSSNLIISPLKASDFDEDSELTISLEYMSFRYNNIPSIESRLFFRKNGSSMFPNLSFLDLSFNNLKNLDLMWPLSLPHPSLKVMISYNKIRTFTNDLKISFNSSNLIAMTSKRIVDVKFNLINRFDDSNLLQYGLKKPYDLEKFLNQIQNYNFNYNKFICVCPPDIGLYTVFWYSQLYSSETNVSRFSCTNIPYRNAFNFSCPFIGTTTTTLGPIITNPSKVSSNVFTSTSNSSEDAVTNQQLDANNKSSLLLKMNVDKNEIVDDSKIAAISLHLWWLLLLLIPIIILPICFCINGRALLLSLYSRVGVVICTCLRRKETNYEKLYDATICYSLFDQNWIEEEFLPSFSDRVRGYKINKLGLNYSKSNLNPVNSSHIECLKSSKRIVLLLTEKFMNNIWTNQNFRDHLKQICDNDSRSVIIMVTIQSTEVIKPTIQIFEHEVKSEIRASYWRKIKSLIRYNFGINKIESLKWNSLKFWPHFLYLMPLLEDHKQTSIKQRKFSKRKTISPLSIIIDSTFNNQSFNKLNSIQNKEPPKEKKFMEKSNFWTRYDESKKTGHLSKDDKNRSNSSLLANILNDDTRKIHNDPCQYAVYGNISVSEANDSSGSILEPNKTVNISVVNTDLFTVKNKPQTEILPKDTKKRKKRNNIKRIKRIEAMNTVYTQNNSCRNIKLPFL